MPAPLLQYKQFIVGDRDNGYRADSWICSSAIYAGIIDDRGGAVIASFSSSPSSNFTSVSRNELSSIPFNSSYPSIPSLAVPKTCHYCSNRDIAPTVAMVVALTLLPFTIPSKSAYFAFVTVFVYFYWLFFPLIPIIEPA